MKEFINKIKSSSEILNENKYFMVGLFEKSTNAWVGQVYVGPTNWALPEFTIGYVADVDCEGQGYISEAVKRIVQSLFEGNRNYYTVV